MPWRYIEPGKGFPANVTDDDANVIGILTNYRLDTRIDSAQAQLEIIVTDLSGWIQGFHREFLGP